MSRISGYDRTNSALRSISVDSIGQVDCNISNWPFPNRTARSLDLQPAALAVFATAGYINQIIVSNQSALKRYLKLYNVANATEANTPITTIVLFTGTYSIDLKYDIRSGGCSCRATTAVANADTGAPDANDVVITVIYNI